MAGKLASGVFLIVVITITSINLVSIGMAARITQCSHWSNTSGTGCVCGGIIGPPPPPPPPPAGRSSNDTTHTHRGPRRISVNWNSSFVYDVWAAKNPRIYVNDTLVFRYRKNSSSNVYSMPDWVSYQTCNFGKGAKLIANSSAGQGHAGFSFTLLKPVREGFPLYYFASKPQCALGMKLQVDPVARPPARP